MATWQEVDDELALWQDSGMSLTLWWRDDDAIEPTEALDRLIRLSSEYEAPCALAVVPDYAQPSLFEALVSAPTIFPVQHGFRHINHAPKGEKAAEFGLHRDRTVIEQDLEAGWQKLAAVKNISPVFVPPWNRMSDELNSCLAALGIKGVSQHAPRKARKTKAGLIQVNTHVDIINWRTTRGFTGTEKALDFALTHLRARRLGEVDPDEPTGILTHHLDHDPACWEFMEKLLLWTRGKPNIQWMTPREAFDIEPEKHELRA